MIGVVTSQNELLLPVRFRSLQGPVEIPVAIDTGFNDYLAMTPTMIEMLGLQPHEAINYQTADGANVSSQYFVGEIEWFGVWKRIPVIEIDGGILLGVAMLDGCRLTVDIVDGGAVRVEKLLS